VRRGDRVGGEEDAELEVMTVVGHEVNLSDPSQNRTAVRFARFQGVRVTPLSGNRSRIGQI
jgi:hypothetical protein